MDIRQLRYFVGVLQAKSLNRAAIVLRVAQPALGVQIRNLERELGAKLLYRHPRGVAPTEAGERLARHATHLLQEFDRVRQDLADYVAKPHGSVLLCMGRSLPRIVAATIAERCRANFPNIQLRMVVGRRKQIDGTSKKLEADLTLTFRPHIDADFVSEPLIQDELLLIYAANRGQLPRAIDFRSLLERPLILPCEPHYVRRLIGTAAHLAGREINLYCEIDSLDTTLELVKRGLADTVLPVAWVREEVEKGKLRTAEIRDQKLHRTLYILHSSRQPHSVAVDLVRREILEIIFEFAHDHTFGWRTIM